MLKVATIVGTRPEIIKMSRVIAAFDRYTNHVLIHTGQNYDYELNKIFFDDLDLRSPDYFLEAAGSNPAETIARVIERADTALEEIQPDALMLYGDTNSCLSIIAAKRRKIPVFHFEAGNRCFDQRVPEELNRKVVDHLSDVNLVLSEHARRYLLAEGLSADRIFKTGSHMPEVLAHYQHKISVSTVLDRLQVAPMEYFVVSVHREENVDSPERLNALMKTLERLSTEHNKPVLVSTHPRTAKRIEAIGSECELEGVTFLRPFGFTDYIRLQLDSACVLSDSGTITEEAALLGLTAINLRQVHERPEGVDEGVTIQADIIPDRIMEAVRVAMAQTKAGFRPSSVNDYVHAGDVSAKALRLVLSYTDFINRFVWHK